MPTKKKKKKPNWVLERKRQRGRSTKRRKERILNKKPRHGAQGKGDDGEKDGKEVGVKP